MSRNSYQVKEIFGPTIQGEGSMVGTVTHFVRMAGCNMWDGREETRNKSRCPYCDTDFVGGKPMTTTDIIKALAKLDQCGWVTLSGGEPALQVDQTLVDTLHRAGYRVAIETNGTRELPLGIDHVTLSPKVSEKELVLKECDDLKILYPHPDKRIHPDLFESVDAVNRYLQPVMDMNYDMNVKATIEECVRTKGRYSLSLQVHKILGLR